MCNSSTVMAEIPEEDQAGEMIISEDNAPTTKTVGLSWNSNDDVFTLPMTSTRRLQITRGMFYARSRQYSIR